MSGRSESLEATPPTRFVLPSRSRGVLTAIQRQEALAHARTLLEEPTTSYFEAGPMQVVHRFAQANPGFRIEQDQHANLLLHWDGLPRRKKDPVPTVVAFSAHLDHPGFHYLGRQRGQHRARLVGSVAERCLPGSALRFHDGETREALATARIASCQRSTQGLIDVRLTNFRGRARQGMFGVFDLSSGTMRGQRLQARVCDDLMGAAAILSSMKLLAQEQHPYPLVGIFTRAEETGFMGCLGLVQDHEPLRHWQVIGLECSPKRASAKPGHGPVIRVGDRLSVFDPELTLALEEAAGDIAGRAPQFRWQRALMDGGSCESSVYNAYGVRAAGACLALGNYHNCTPQGTIAPEFVDWSDYEGLIALLAQVARNLPVREARTKIKQRLNRFWEREYKLLADSSLRLKAKTPR